MKTTRQLTQDVIEKIKNSKRKRKKLARASGQALATCLVCALLLPTIVKINPFASPTATPIWQETNPSPVEKEKPLLRQGSPFETAQIR